MLPIDSSAIDDIKAFCFETAFALSFITRMNLMKKKRIGMKPARKAAASIGYNAKIMITTAVIETKLLKNIDTLAEREFSTTSASEFKCETTQCFVY